MDGRTDTPSYRDARAHPKNGFGGKRGEKKRKRRKKIEIPSIHSDVIGTLNSGAAASPSVSEFPFSGSSTDDGDHNLNTGDPNQNDTDAQRDENEEVEEEERRETGTVKFAVYKTYWKVKCTQNASFCCCFEMIK